MVNLPNPIQTVNTSEKLASITDVSEKTYRMGAKKTVTANLPQPITPIMEILKINKNKNQEEYKYEHKVT